MAIYRNCACVELTKLKSPLKCKRALRRHLHVKTAGVVPNQNFFHCPSFISAFFYSFMNL